MQHFYIWLSALLAASAVAQDTDSAVDTRAFTTLTGRPASDITSLGTSYATGSGQVTLTRTSDLVNQVPTGTASRSSGTGTETETTTSPGSTSTITLLQGGGAGIQTLSIINGTVTLYPNTTVSTTGSSTSTSSSVQPTNTQPCNGWPEFCSRGYGNITQVAAHNAYFNIKGNAARNQAYSVTQQLDDGIRMLTGGTKYVNDTIFSCHTSCDLLNAGTLESNYREVANWVRSHPYDVVTLLIANSDIRPVDDFVPAIQNSGLGAYLYEPPLFPMRLDQWPTLSELILSQKRVIIFMDYEADQQKVPYILDQYSHMWETPFSPQDINFPCDPNRPPDLSPEAARDDLMYLANHNLNTAIAFGGSEFLIPNTADIVNTNAAGNETGMLGAMDDRCEQQWGRSPNWLLVDFYDQGNGSVFEVAARANGVTYDRDCCGVPVVGAASDLKLRWSMMVVAFVLAGLQLA